MTKNSVAQFCAIAAVVTLPSLSFAGTTTKKCCAPAAPEKLAESVISGDLGLNVVSAYYSRGIIATNHSASFQPYVDVAYKAYEGTGFINKAVVNLGLWESFTNPKFAPANIGNNKSWFESDFTPGITLTSGKFSVSESWVFMNYPNALAGTDAQALQTKVSFDDADLLGALALHPALTFLTELDGKTGNSVSAASKNKKGQYWELAVAPGTAVGPVTVTLPLTLGLGSGKFYARDGYGFFSAGLNLAYALPVAKNLGSWTANAGATYYNTDRKATGNRSDNDVVVSGGLGVAF